MLCSSSVRLEPTADDSSPSAVPIDPRSAFHVTNHHAWVDLGISPSKVGGDLSGVQIGIFTIGDVTRDPTTGITPTESERIQATVTIAKKAEEVGLDVFATGEHRNPHRICIPPSGLSTATVHRAVATRRRPICGLPTTLEQTVGPSQSQSTSADPQTRQPFPRVTAHLRTSAMPVAESTGSHS